MHKSLLLTYLDARRAPLAGDEELLELHSRLCEQAPEFYLRLLNDPQTDLSHKRQILLNVLLQSSARNVERAQMLKVLSALPVSEALSVLDILRLRQINNRRARDLVLTYLIGHEQFPLLAATRKHHVRRLLKHALGEKNWSAVERFLTSSAGTRALSGTVGIAECSVEGELLLQRELLRFARDGEATQAREAIAFLAGVFFIATEPILRQRQQAREDLDKGAGLPRETLLGLRGIYHKQVSVKETLSLAAPLEGKGEQSDGAVTKLYKEAFQLAVEDAQLYAGPIVAEQLAQIVKGLPTIEGRVALVLDLSASMRSSGERLYHPAALALALARLIEARVSEVTLYIVGGPDEDFEAADKREHPGFAQPQGATDLASALLRAVREEPVAVLVVTDGYENVCQGDTQLVVQGLRQLGITLPVYQIVPVYKLAEKLPQRRLGEAIPIIPLDHEDGVRELLARVLLASVGEDLSVQEQEQVQQLLLKR